MAELVIAVVGGIYLDLLVETQVLPAPGESAHGSSLGRYCGGKAANSAIAAYRASRRRQDQAVAPTAGVSGGNDVGYPEAQKTTASECPLRVYLNGAVGNDETGSYLLSSASQNGIDVSQVQILDGEQSRTCIVLVEAATGDTRFIVFQGATKKWKLRGQDSVNSLAAGWRLPDLIICHFSVPLPEVMQIVARAKKERVDLVLNPSPAALVEPAVFRDVAHMVMNQVEAAVMSSRAVAELDDRGVLGEISGYFLRFGVRNVVITLADRGAYFATAEGASGTVEAEEGVEVLDTTGAGDTFVGTYAVDYLRQKKEGVWDIRRAVKRACRASARTIERLGAQQSIPWADEVDS